MLTVLSVFSFVNIIAPILANAAPLHLVPSLPDQQQIQAPPQQVSPPVRPVEPPPPRQVEVIRPQDVRPLPGKLDSVPVFNSNSPEVVQTDGILLSTFPPNGMQVPSAHLNFSFQGRFDLLAHHIARGLTANDVRTLYLGVIVHNPNARPVTLDILQAVSYLSQDAPFVNLPDYVADPTGTVYAGPGSRTSSDILRGERQSPWPAQVIIPANSTYLLVNVPIPLRRLTVPTDGSLPPGSALLPPPAPPKQTTASNSLASLASASDSDLSSNSTPSSSGLDQNLDSPSSSSPFIQFIPSSRDAPTNGRTILMRLSSDGPVYMASLAMYAPQAADGSEQVPTLTAWEQLLLNSNLVSPRDRPPSLPNLRAFIKYYYGRVAGVSQGAEWTARAADRADGNTLKIPQAGQEISYVLSTVDHNTFGTGQIQSAPMLVRYPDTSYRAHGNYGTQYNISLPLYNDTNTTQKVKILLQTPVQDEKLHNALKFREPPDNMIFFRGTVRLRYTDDSGVPVTQYVHIVQRRGQEGEPLIQLNMPRGDRRLVEVQLIYPPDATPPQVLTVATEENHTVANEK